MEIFMELKNDGNPMEISISGIYQRANAFLTCAQALLWV
jgi:hypothetical protein